MEGLDAWPRNDAFIIQCSLTGTVWLKNLWEKHCLHHTRIMSGRLYSECSKNIFVCTISLKLLLVGQLLCDFFHVGTDLVIDVHIHGYITFSEVNMWITGNNGDTWWRLSQSGCHKVTYIHFRFLHWAILCLQNTSQVTCSNTSKLESICEILPAGVFTGSQPSLEHLQELAFGVRGLYSDTLQSSDFYFQLKSKLVPLCRYVQNFL